MIKRKAQVGQNCQDNKCHRSSRSMIIIHFPVAANEYSNVVGERFWRDYSFMFPGVCQCYFLLARFGHKTDGHIINIRMFFKFFMFFLPMALI